MNTLAPPLDRKLLLVSGADARSFLDSIASVNIARMQDKDAAYGLLLSPKGRFRYDFFVHHLGEDRFLLDVFGPTSKDFFKALRLYKLRAAVTLEFIEATLYIIDPDHLRDAQDNVTYFRDPRDGSLGYRLWADAALDAGPSWSAEAYHRRRIAACIPESGWELITDKTIPLEAGLDTLGALDFQKGCYPGQELQARTKHTGTVRKHLCLLKCRSQPAQGDAVYPSTPSKALAPEKPLGHITSLTSAPEAGTYALAILRDTDAPLPQVNVAGVPADIIKKRT